MAASYDPLKERIPRILTARESYLEQQRCILLEVTLIKHDAPSCHYVLHLTADGDEGRVRGMREEGRVRGREEG